MYKDSYCTPNPFLPVRLPEFGTAISFAMCHNPSCDSFGLPFTGDAPASWKGPGSVRDDRYRIDIKSKSLTCRNCEQRFRLRSNAAIRHVARHFLSLSLPFADCPNRDCVNHGYNIFEHYHPNQPVSDRRYRKYGRDSAICRECDHHLMIGEPLAVSTSRAAQEALKEIVNGVAKTRFSPTDAVEATGVSEDTFYTRLFRAGARIRDHHAYRNAALLREKFSQRDKPLFIATDELILSLKRRGKGQRFLEVGVLLTSARLDDGSLFTIAAHLKFLPQELAPKDRSSFKYVEDVTDEWDCIPSPRRLKTGKTLEETVKKLSDFSRRGYFITPYYAEVAHFLVVRKLLSRFPTIHHCMDRGSEINAAALVALAEPIRHGRWEIVNFQHDKTFQPVNAPARDTFYDKAEWRSEQKPDFKERKLQNLDAQWSAMLERFDGQIRAEGMPLGGTGDRKVLAKVYRRAFRGANSEKSSWAWLDHPPPPHRFRKPRLLWMTWHPDKCYETTGRELLCDASLNAVDSVFGAMRQRTHAFARPPSRAAAGRARVTASWDPRLVNAELWIHLFWRNYALRKKTDRTYPVAQAFGLSRKNERNPDLFKLAMNFRLDMSHVEKMSKWCRT